MGRSHLRVATGASGGGGRNVSCMRTSRGAQSAAAAFAFGLAGGASPSDAGEATVSRSAGEHGSSSEMVEVSLEITGNHGRPLEITGDEGDHGRSRYLSGRMRWCRGRSSRTQVPVNQRRGGEGCK